MHNVILGVDLGPRSDWTAIMAVYRYLPEGAEKHHYDLLHLERGHWELRGVIERVAAVRAEVEHHFGRDTAWVVLDQTGVGEFVVGPFREAGLNPIPVIITGGVKPTYSWRGKPPRRPSNVAAKATVPKRDLVSVLQVLLEMDRLHIAAGLPDLNVLVRELENFRAKITTAGNDTYEAWREGDHDDTVLATALACWFAERMLPGIERPGAVMRGYPLDGRSRAAAPFPAPALR